MDQAQIRQSLQACHRDSFGWALCCCHRDRPRAEEVLQHVYLKVLEGRARFNPLGHASLRTWLFAVIRRTAADVRRCEWLRLTRLTRLATARPVQPTQTDDWREVFLAALERLSRRQREVLHLVFYQGMTLEQAAAVMSVRIGSARTHYDRGKKAIRAYLIDRGLMDDDLETIHAPLTAPTLA